MGTGCSLMGTGSRRRRCGCLKSDMSGWEHWCMYTRLRLLGRKAACWVEFWSVKRRYLVYYWAGRVSMDHIVPIMVGLGIMDPQEGLEWVRRAEGTERRLKAWLDDQMFLGASKEHPGGVYARGGGDLVCMTEDEDRHWYGGRGDSGGGQEGA